MKCVVCGGKVEPQKVTFRRPRHGWEEKFKAMHQRSDDRFLDGDVVSKWDEMEREWMSRRKF